MISEAVDVSGVACFVLAAGAGERLRPLTRSTPRPLLMYGGVCRLLDFTLSNVSNSGLDQACILTQSRKDAIGDYLRGHWSLSRSQPTRFVHQPPTKRERDTGPASAVAANLDRVAPNAGLILVLPADHVYRMDYRKMIRRHREAGAGVTVAAFPAPRGDARQLGIMTANPDGRIASLVERKPRLPEAVPEDRLLANMGIYVFDRTIFETAVAELGDSGAPLDFGRDIVPHVVARGQAQAFPVQTGRGQATYWREIGTVDAYLASNLDLLGGELYSNLFLDPQWPIRRSLGRAGEEDALQPGLPPWCGSVVASPIPPGSCTIENSIVGPGVTIGEDADVFGSILLPGARVGSCAMVRNTIVDSYASVEEGDEVGYSPRDHRRFEVTDSGIVIVSSARGERTLAAHRSRRSGASRPARGWLSGMEGRAS